jgi:hypothetical protein
MKGIIIAGIVAVFISGCTTSRSPDYGGYNKDLGAGKRKNPFHSPF